MFYCGTDVKISVIKRIKAYILVFLMLMLLCLCSRKADEAEGGKGVKIFTVTDTVVSTGIYPKRGQIVYIFPVDVTGEDLFFVDEDKNYYPFLPSWVPLFSFGGNKFLPAPYGVAYKVRTEEEGKELLIMANGKSSVKVRIEVVDSDSPIPSSPRANEVFFGLAPIISWEPERNAQKYILQISRFPDFRTVEYSLEILGGTGGESLLFNIPLLDLIFGGGQGRRIFLTEGVWYYRLRVQRNLGRPLAPDIRWSDYSPGYQFGVEWGSAPVLLVQRPKDKDRFKVGDNISFLLLSSTDPSGNLAYLEIREKDCASGELRRKVLGPYFMYDWFFTDLGVYQKYEFNFNLERKKYEFAVMVRDSLSEIFRMYKDVPLGSVIFEQGIPIEFKIRIALNFDSLFSLRETKSFYELDLCDGGEGEIRFKGAVQGQSLQVGAMLSCIILNPQVVGILTDQLKKMGIFPDEIPTVRFPLLRFELTNPLSVTSIVFDFFKPNEEGEPPTLRVDFSQFLGPTGFMGFRLGFADFVFKNFQLRIDFLDTKPKIYFALDGHIPDPAFLTSVVLEAISSFPSSVSMIGQALSGCIPEGIRGLIGRFFGGIF